MFRLSKKVEYGILSMQYLADRERTLVSAKEISDNLELSFEFLAKTLQKLMKQGLISSTKGIKGGYLLAKPSEEITLSEIIEALDSKIFLAECMDDDHSKACARHSNCSIKKPLLLLQNKVTNIFQRTLLSELKSSKESNYEAKIQIDLRLN